MGPVTKCSSSQGEAIANDDRLIKRDINVYRSHVKITAYNSHGYKVRIFLNLYFVLSQFKGYKAKYLNIF